MSKREDRQQLRGYEHLTGLEQKYVEVLRRRAEHLAKRIKSSPQELSYDDAELAAIHGLLAWIARH